MKNAQDHNATKPIRVTLAGLALFTLTACSQPPPPVKHDFSDRALAALPPGQDLSLVYRGRDGCYKYIKENQLSGYILPLIDEYDQQICDDVTG